MCYYYVVATDVIDSANVIPAATTNDNASLAVVSSLTMYPPLSKVFFNYPDSFNDYTELKSSINTTNAQSSISDILKISQEPIASIDDFVDEQVTEEEEQEDDSENEEEEEEEDIDNDFKNIKSTVVSSGISVGEIALNNIKSQLEKLGYVVEFKISMVSAGGSAALVCDGQVLIRKHDVLANHFIVEGKNSVQYAIIKTLNLYHSTTH